VFLSEAGYVCQPRFESGPKPRVGRATAPAVDRAIRHIL